MSAEPIDMPEKWFSGLQETIASLEFLAYAMPTRHPVRAMLLNMAKACDELMDRQKIVADSKQIKDNK